MVLSSTFFTPDFRTTSRTRSPVLVNCICTLLDLRVLAQSIDAHYWERKSELNRQTFVTSHTTSIISTPTSSSTMPSNSEPTSDSESISDSISDSGHPDPSSDLPNPHSFISKNSEDPDSEAAEPTFELGPDGKLFTVECQ